MNSNPASAWLRSTCFYAVIWIGALATAAICHFQLSAVTAGAAVIVQFALFFQTVILQLYRRGPSRRATRMTVFAATVLSIATNVGCFAVLYRSAGIVDRAGDRIDASLLDAAGFSLGSLVHIGFGDLAPAAEARLIAAGQALSGFAYLAILIGLVVGIAARRGFIPPPSTRS